jgi:cyclopropane fatty-acyl-phospholipid synthase-like methyltransferase
VAPDEARKNNARGLKTLLMDYKDMPHEYDSRFDGIIANGSMEHFVQFDEALAGKQDQIYSEMFSIMSRILKPKGRVATTVIHFRLHFDAKEIKEGAGTFKRDDLNFLGSRLMYAGSAWYPTGEQLIECSKPYFRNVRREDGTEDYRRTSEEWIRMWKKGALTNPKAWLILVSRFIRNPIWTVRSFDNMVISQFWTAQFRDWHGQGVPTTLFRDTWEKIM